LAFFIWVLDAAVVTARIKEGSVELHSMHCSAQVREEIDKRALQAMSEGSELELGDEKLVCAKCTRDYVGTTNAARKDGYKRELICPRCVSKRVIFTRMFGHWPIQSFKELSAENQVLVWQGGNNKDALHHLLQKKIIEQKIDEEELKDEGSYLPLSVYANLGYKTDTLETTCPKKWDLELKDWTYKKTVTTDRKSEIGKMCMEELLNLRSTDLRSKLSHYQSPSKKKRSSKSKKRKRSVSPSKSDSSSNSSKSSNSGSDSEPEVVDSPRTMKANAAKAAKEAAEAAKIEKTKAAIESKAARVRALKQAKEDKAEAALALKREAAEAKQAAKDPILISMHMHIGTFYYSKHAVVTACLSNPIATACF
jgi:DNA-directed RNA polymerase subunit RPC12/RpoP